MNWAYFTAVLRPPPDHLRLPVFIRRCDRTGTPILPPLSDSDGDHRWKSRSFATRERYLSNRQALPPSTMQPNGTNPNALHDLKHEVAELRASAHHQQAMTTALVEDNMRTRNAIDRHMIACRELAEATAIAELIRFAGWRCGQLLQQQGARRNSLSATEANSFAQLCLRSKSHGCSMDSFARLAKRFLASSRIAPEISPNLYWLGLPSAGRVQTAHIVFPSFAEMVNTLGVDKNLAHRSVLRRTPTGVRILGSMSCAPAVRYIQIGENVVSPGVSPIRVRLVQSRSVWTEGDWETGLDVDNTVMVASQPLKHSMAFSLVWERAAGMAWSIKDPKAVLGHFRVYIPAVFATSPTVIVSVMQLMHSALPSGRSIAETVLSFPE